MEKEKLKKIKTSWSNIRERILDKVEHIQDAVNERIAENHAKKFVSYINKDKQLSASLEQSKFVELSKDTDTISLPTDDVMKRKVLTKMLSKSADDLHTKKTAKDKLIYFKDKIHDIQFRINDKLAERSRHSDSKSCSNVRIVFRNSDDTSDVESDLGKNVDIEFARGRRYSQSSTESNASANPENAILGGSSPGVDQLYVPYPCNEMLDKLGNRFPRFRQNRTKIERYLMKNTLINEVSKRLKAQIWSSVVTIVLVEAKNLKAMDSDTASSDPYVKFRLGNEKYKSKVIWKSLHPSWLEQFDLHLYEDQEQVLEVTVWDKDKQSKDDFLGKCTIDLNVLEREITHNLWKDLEEGTGQIFLLLTISGTTHSETITDLTSYHENKGELEEIEKKFAWYKLKEPSNSVGWLCVKVYGAKGLAAADLGGKSDPFCVLELGNARLQTHTEYKTLAPNWMKIFTFSVKDISQILEITVYDEDSDHKVEFLGKLSIPLLRIRNGEKRWYCLKDKKMRARAKGNNPQILLEMVVIWNPVKAAIRVLNPKEEKFMQQESKFKRQVFIRNVVRLKAIIMWFIEVGKILQDCFEWESRLRSFFGLTIWLLFCYNYQMWMAPCILLIIFGRSWLIYRLTGGNQLLQAVDDDDLLEEDEDDPEADKEEKKSLKERLQAIQEVTQSVQNAIGFVASLGEEVKNLVNFTVPYYSYLAIMMLMIACTVLYLIPLRYLLMAWGVNKFTRKILRPHSIPNNEVLDLLSRVPDDEILLDCRELKPQYASDARISKRKHKAS